LGSAALGHGIDAPGDGCPPVAVAPGEGCTPVAVAADAATGNDTASDTAMVQVNAAAANRPMGGNTSRVHRTSQLVDA